MAVGGAGIGNLACRVLLVVSAAVVLGLSVWLDHEFDYLINVCRVFHGDDELCSLGRWPSSVSYGAFTGAFGLLAALVGFAPVFVAVNAVWLAAFVLDALAAVFYLAGGINLAVLFNQYGGGDAFCEGDDGDSEGLCSTIETRVRADIAFLFIGFIISLVTLALLFLIRRSRK